MPSYTDAESIREGSVAGQNINFGENLAQGNTSTFGEMFGPVDANFWTDVSTNYSGFEQAESSAAASHRASWDTSLASSSAMQPNLDEPSLFGNTFDWSNMDDHLASLNIQLATPAMTLEHQPFSRTASVTMDQSPHVPSHLSLSPGAQGDAMLYTPFSAPANDMFADEGCDEFTQDLVARPAHDFDLFDSSVSGMDLHANGAMFADLAALTGTHDLTQQLGFGHSETKMEE